MRRCSWVRADQPRTMPPPEANQRGADKSPVLLVPASLLAATGGWGLTAAGAGATTLADQYGTGLVMVGLLTTVFAFTYAGLQVPAGQLTDRFGVRRTALAGMGVTALAYVGALLIPHLCLPSSREVWAGPAARLGSWRVPSLPAAPVQGRSDWDCSVVSGSALAGLPSRSYQESGRLSTAVPWAGVRHGGYEPRHGEPHGDYRHQGDQVRRQRRQRPANDVVRPSLICDGKLYRLTTIHAATFGLGVVLSNWAAVVLTERWGLEPALSAVIGSLILVLTMISRPLGGAILGRFPAAHGR